MTRPQRSPSVDPARTLTREQVRELDRRAIEDCGFPSLVLMENAGRACADEARVLLEERGAAAGAAGAPVAVLCGPGNNGGDGLVVARTLHNRGVPAEAWFVGDPGKLERASEDVRTNARLYRGLGLELRVLAAATDLGAARAALAGAPLVVDALFGTGLQRPLKGRYFELVELINGLDAPVLAVDAPSGLDADTGAVLGAAVRAAATVTFVAPKPGLARGEGPRCAGRVVVAEIGIPRFLLEEALG